MLKIQRYWSIFARQLARLRDKFTESGHPEPRQPINLTDTIKEYLTELQFTYQDNFRDSHLASSSEDNSPSKRQNVIQSDVDHILLSISTKENDWECLIRIIHKQELVAVYSILPIKVAPPLLPVMVALITRINYDLILGNFEMDMRDGELRFKTSLDTEPVTFDIQTFKYLLYSNFSMVERYFNVFKGVLEGNHDIDDILKHADVTTPTDSEENEQFYEPTKIIH